jgi:hypothetical protein
MNISPCCRAGVDSERQLAEAVPPNRALKMNGKFVLGFKRPWFGVVELTKQVLLTAYGCCDQICCSRLGRDLSDVNPEGAGRATVADSMVPPWHHLFRLSFGEIA